MVFHGKVIGIRDVITYEGATAEELVDAFRGSVDAYLAMCTRDGIEPAKPFSGKLALRMTPELHAAVHRAAAISAKSINQWILDALADQLARPSRSRSFRED